MLRLIIAAACLCAMIAQARSSDLSGEQINDLLAGATVEIDTPVGTKLPVRYGRDGKLSGRAGGLGWYLGAATDTGKWWVAGDQVCHRWSRWFDSVPQCLRLRKQGRILQWRTPDGHSGTATISMPPGTRVATVVPSAQPSPKKAAAPPETPPAPPKAPAPADTPKHPPDEVAGDAGKVAPHSPMPAPAATEKDPVLPKPVLPTQQDEAPQKRAEPKRADRAPVQGRQGPQRRCSQCPQRSLGRLRRRRCAAPRQPRHCHHERLSVAVVPCTAPHRQRLGQQCLPRPRGGVGLAVRRARLSQGAAQLPKTGRARPA